MITQITTKEHLKAVVESPEFKEFCSNKCPVTENGCKGYCPFTFFQEALK